MTIILDTALTVMTLPILLRSANTNELKQFNSDREMLGLARTQAFYREVAEQSPEAIIARLREAGAAWGNGQPPEDDVTFVILKSRAV